MEGIIGKKIGMTRIFNQEGHSIPVTVIEAGPCPVVQVKIKEKEGYGSVQLGFGEKRKTLFNLPLSGHFAKAKVEPKRMLKEIRIKEGKKVEVGQEVKVDIFSVGDRVCVTGISKGLGFQGGVRRHKFHGGPKSHGQSDRLRAPGSIGGSSFPSRVFKGQRMAGRMGDSKVTVRNLMVAGVDAEKNLLLVKGAVPGKRNSYLTIKKVLA
ncbi:MAG: 50S ribosomal protein L3 [candidate division Zixibacteria bacterium SM1_73]|nr:MAG: 50S ribosomal protein L3 [candidate division Zixibacteria bacterium SM1_73]